MRNDIMVSICCITYNHEAYIADAIESFLMQKTDFPIELIIHDDASTDNTANIIREYENKYPDIIKPVYQKENQYSKSKSILANFIYPKVKGKYIALCEGDDFWIDPHKLQKQVEFLESHIDYSMCFHAVKYVDTRKYFLGSYFGLHGNGSNEYTLDKIGQGLVHINSILMKSMFFKTTLPPWLTNKDYGMYGDNKLAIYLAIVGRTYFIDEVMSAYRSGVANSVMTKARATPSNTGFSGYFKSRCSIIDEIDAYYDYKYHSSFAEIRLHSEIYQLIEENNFRGIKSHVFYKQLSFKTKLIVNTKYYIPRIYNFIKSFYHALRHFLYSLRKLSQK